MDKTKDGGPVRQTITTGDWSFDIPNSLIRTWLAGMAMKADIGKVGLGKIDPDDLVIFAESYWRLADIMLRTGGLVEGDDDE